MYVLSVNLTEDELVSCGGACLGAIAHIEAILEDEDKTENPTITYSKKMVEAIKKIASPDALRQIENYEIAFHQNMNSAGLQEAMIHSAENIGETIQDLEDQEVNIKKNL